MDNRAKQPFSCLVPNPIFFRILFFFFPRGSIHHYITDNPRPRVSRVTYILSISYPRVVLTMAPKAAKKGKAAKVVEEVVEEEPEQVWGRGEF